MATACSDPPSARGNRMNLPLQRLQLAVRCHLVVIKLQLRLHKGKFKRKETQISSKPDTDSDNRRYDVTQDRNLEVGMGHSPSDVVNISGGSSSMVSPYLWNNIYFKFWFLWWHMTEWEKVWSQLSAHLQPFFRLLVRILSFFEEKYCILTCRDKRESYLVLL